RRFARYWDLVANSGNFRNSLPLLWGDDSPFDWFSQFSDWLFAREGRGHGIPLTRLTEHVFRFLTEERQIDETLAAEHLLSDYRRGGRRDTPRVLQKFSITTPVESRRVLSAPVRQARHLGEG
ncbi:MAG: DUF4080 domain-containing protein, partial [Planctomycetes bacterium]|nr:DUF4080 domain-containing protein [Planctomycetota bacterium]